MKPKIKVDIVSDVVCPWCYIGKRRLEKAIDQLRDEYDFELEYHPFELNPEMPANGADQKAYLVKKFGSESRYEQITQQVTGVAATEGLTFDFSRQHISPNTRRAHAVIAYAREQGVQLQTVEALFKAYFTDGVNLSDKQNLIATAVAAGLDRAAVEKVIDDEHATMQVALAEQEMYKLGISGVPFYIINNKYGVSGAQNAETFIQAFREIGKAVEVPASADGEACDIDGKNC